MDGAQCVDALLALSHPQDAAALSADEGLALMSILSVVPTKLPDKHRLFACLQCSVLAAESMDGFMSALRVAVALGQETSHAHALSAMLESCHEAMDRAVAIAISHDEPLAEMKMDHLRFAALKTDPVVALSSSVLCPAAVELLALLVLLLLLVSFKDNSVSASTVLELLQNDLDLTVRVLARTLESAIGVVPGVSPTVREPRMQRYVAHSILRILVQLTSWTTYSSVYCRRNPNQFGTTSMQAQSGAFRVHVYRVSCAFIQTRILLSLTAYAQQQWLRGVDSSAMADVVRELLFLINNMLTLTNVGVVQLRGFIAATKFVQHLLMPFLILQFQELHGSLKQEESTARRCLPAFYASCGLCCEVLATLCFGNRLMQQQLSSRISDVQMGVLLEDKNVPVSSSLAAPRGVREVDARVRSNFVSQLIRLCINGNLEQDVVLQQTRLVWERLLTEREKDSMRWAMVNPMRRRQPIDIHSRNYAFFQQLLVLPAELTSSKDAEGQVAPAAQAGGGARGQASNRGASRRRGRGRRRKQRRYAQLKERQAPPPTAGHAAPKKSGDGSASTQAQSTVANQPTDSKKNLAAVDGVERNHLNADEEEHQLAQLESSDEEDDEEDAPHREQGGDDGSTSEADDDGAGHARTGGLDLSPWRTRSAPPMGIPSRYICSLTLGIIQSVPMLSPRGLLFDRDKILDFLRVHRCCPVTGDSLYPNDLIADEDLEKELRAVRFQFINLM